MRLGRMGLVIVLVVLGMILVVPGVVLVVLEMFLAALGRVTLLSREKQPRETQTTKSNENSTNSRKAFMA